MSATTMAVLGYLAYRGIKHLSKSHAAGSAGTPTFSGILVGFSMGGLGGILSGGFGNLIAKGTAGAALSMDWGGAPAVSTERPCAGGKFMGPGANKDISEQGLAKSLGQKDINSLSQQTGMSREDLLSALRHEPPNIIDQLTPQE